MLRKHNHNYPVYPNNNNLRNVLLTFYSLEITRVVGGHHYYTYNRINFVRLL